MTTYQGKKIKEIIKEKTWQDNCMNCGEERIVTSCGHCSITLCKECMTEHLES